MGTRADFYVGRGSSAEWLGSIAWDGYPDDEDVQPLADLTDEDAFRAEVAKILESRDDGTTPDMGWPWPWDNSNTTDFSYAFDGGKVWATSFGHGWWPMKEGEPEDSSATPKIPDSEWPDMSDRQNVTLGRRSGVIALG